MQLFWCQLKEKLVDVLLCNDSLSINYMKLQLKSCLKVINSNTKSFTWWLFTVRTCENNINTVFTLHSIKQVCFISWKFGTHWFPPLLTLGRWCAFGKWKNATKVSFSLTACGDYLVFPCDIIKLKLFLFSYHQTLLFIATFTSGTNWFFCFRLYCSLMIRILWYRTQLSDFLSI